MMKQVAMVGVLLMSAQMALAGASNGFIKCESSSGRTKVEADFPVDFDEASISVTVDGKSQTYINQSMIDNLKLNAHDPQVTFHGYKVADIQTSKDKKSLAMAALTPTADGTLVSLSLVSTAAPKKVSGGVRNEVLQFKAIVSGLDPRTDLTSQLPEGVSVTCTYNYSI